MKKILYNIIEKIVIAIIMAAFCGSMVIAFIGLAAGY